MCVGFGLVGLLEVVAGEIGQVWCGGVGWSGEPGAREAGSEDEAEVYH